MGGDADLVSPDSEGVFVLFEDARNNAVGGQLKDFCRELPGPGDRLFFEVVAKAKVAQHLKKRMVTRGAAYVFNIVGADALL